MAAGEPARTLNELLQAVAGPGGCALPHAPPWKLTPKQLHLTAYEALLVAVAERERSAAAAFANKRRDEEAELHAPEANMAQLRPTLVPEHEVASAASSGGSPSLRRAHTPALPPTVPTPPSRSLSEHLGEGSAAARAAGVLGSFTESGLLLINKVASYTLSAASSSPSRRAAAPGALRSPAPFTEVDVWRVAFGLSRREHKALAAGMRPPEELQAAQLFADGTLASAHYHLLLLSVRLPHHFPAYVDFSAWAERRLAHVACALLSALADADAEARAAGDDILWNLPTVLGAVPQRGAAARAAIAELCHGMVRALAVDSASKPAGSSGAGAAARHSGTGRLMRVPQVQKGRSAQVSKPNPGGAAGRQHAAQGGQRSSELRLPLGWDEAAHMSRVRVLNCAAWELYAEMAGKGTMHGAAALLQRLPVAFPFGAWLWGAARTWALESASAAAIASGLTTAAPLSFPAAVGSEAGFGDAALDEAEAEVEAEAEAAAELADGATEQARALELQVEMNARRMLQPLAACVSLSRRRRVLCAASIALERWASDGPFAARGSSELDAAALARCLRTIRRDHLAAVVRGIDAACMQPSNSKAAAVRGPTGSARSGADWEMPVDAEWLAELCRSVSLSLRPLVLDYHAHAQAMRRREFKHLADAFCTAYVCGRTLSDAVGWSDEQERSRSANDEKLSLRSRLAQRLSVEGKSQRGWPPWEMGTDVAGKGGKKGKRHGKDTERAMDGGGGEEPKLTARTLASQLAGVNEVAARAEARAIIWPAASRTGEAEIGLLQRTPVENAQRKTDNDEVAAAAHRSTQSEDGGAEGMRAERAELRKARADDLYKQGLVANAEGDFRRARDCFDRSHALDPSWATILSSANMRLKIGEVGVAAELYEAIGYAFAGQETAAKNSRAGTPQRGGSKTSPPASSSGTGKGSTPAHQAGSKTAVVGDEDSSNGKQKEKGKGRVGPVFGRVSDALAAKAREKLAAAVSVRNAWKEQLAKSYSTDEAIADAERRARDELRSAASPQLTPMTGDGVAEGAACSGQGLDPQAALRVELLECVLAAALSQLRRLVQGTSPPLEVEVLADLTEQLRDTALLEVKYFGPVIDHHLAVPSVPASAPAQVADSEADAADLTAVKLALRVYGWAYERIASASLRELGAAVDEREQSAQQGRADTQVENLERSLPLWPALAELDDLLMGFGGWGAPLLPTRALLEPLVREWINYQSARFNDRLQLLVSEETWAPLDDSGAGGWHAASVVDLYSLFMQTIKAFLSMPLPHTAEWSHDICRVSDLICNQYVNRMLQQLGPRARLVPAKPKPELQAVDKMFGAMSRASAHMGKSLPNMHPLQLTDSLRSSGLLPTAMMTTSIREEASKRREATQRSTEAARMSVRHMCVRLNSLVFAHSQLTTLRKFVEDVWERLSVEDETDKRTGQRYKDTLLRASEATLRLAAREVAMHLGTRVSFVDTRARFLDSLHAQPAGVSSGALAALLEELIAPALETVTELVLEGPTRTTAVLGICCGAISAYERVLLDGGALRVFEPKDGPILRADAEHLCEFFVAKDGDGKTQGLPEELVETAARRFHSVLDLFEVQSETLTAQFTSAPEVDSIEGLTQHNIARVLMHRPDEHARKWVKEHAKQLTELLYRHEQTNVHADELLTDTAALELGSRESDVEALRQGAEDARQMEMPTLSPGRSGRAATAADLAHQINSARSNHHLAITSHPINM